MLKQKYHSIFASLLAVVFALAATGCDVSGDQGEQDAPEPYFSYEVWSESGEILKKVSSEHIEEIESETSLGLFGEQFYPPWLAALIAESLDIDPEDLNLDRHEIWLHAENGFQEEVHFATLQFSFPSMNDWNEGTYHVIPIFSPERWLEHLRLIWEMRREHNEQAGMQNLQSMSVIPEIDEYSLIFNYNESGFVQGGIRYMFLQEEGYTYFVVPISDVVV
jgi:hypothetical protein